MKLLLLIGLVSFISSSFASELTCKSSRTGRVYTANLGAGVLQVYASDDKKIYEIPDLDLSAETIDLYPVTVLHTLKNKDNGQTVFEFTEAEGQLFADFESDTNIPCRYN